MKEATISYYDRYLGGEYAIVWEELTQLGAAVYSESLHADALAVARETMRRAQANIILLQQRLGALGYHFGTTHFKPMTCFWLEDECRAPVPYMAALTDATTKLSAIEATQGRLPLSVRVWFELIDSVNFVGAVAAAYANQQNNPIESAARLRPRSGALPVQALPAQVVGFMQTHPEVVDPLWCWPLGNLHDLLAHPASGENWSQSLCPDAPVKGGEPGGVSYMLTESGQVAYAWLVSERWRLRFVPYLRHCLLEWAGFPGLGEWGGFSPSVMSPLTTGLTPF